MKQKTLLDMLLYVLGMCFNLALMALVGYAVFRFTVAGFNFGGAQAAYMVGTSRECDAENEEDCECDAIARATTVEIVLDDYTTLAQMSRILYEHELVSNPWIFRVERILMNRTADFRPGTFTLNHGMSSSQLNNALRTLPPQERQFQWITIPEGWTIADMAADFERRGFFTAEEFIEAAQYGQFNYSFLMNVPRDRPNRLEGYLFPDTYEISMTPTPEHIIHRMLMRFEQLFTQYYQNQAYEMGMTIDEVVIMASIIEREAVLPHERPMVSQVIHNRMDVGMLLQMCSTVTYTIGPRDRLTYEETRTPSPWNTYLHPGLPIGPIANPGWASIRAVLFPQPSNYLFFVLRDAETGAHHFSATLAEHDAAAARYLD